MRGCAILALVVAALGCSDDGVDPITKITGPRVLAVVTEPSALPLDGSIRLTALTIDPDGPRSGIGAATPPGGRPVDAVRMRACAPWKFIADPERDCVGADALTLSTNSSGQIVATAEELAAAFPSPPGVVAPPDPWRVAIAAGLELRVPIIVEVDVDGQTLVARRDIHVVETAAERKNPILAEIRFDGVATQTLRAGQRYDLTATVDPASLDPQDGDNPDRVLETVDCYFYSAAGDLAEPEVDIEEPDVPVPETEPNAYTAGPAGSTWMFVVATDETGGMAADWIPLTIE
jgi:hypothetical protein